MACKNRTEQAKRDSKGRFKPGASGNPSGRPVGLSCRAVMAARAWAEEKGLPLLMEAAEAGDIDACRFLVGLGVPKQKPVSLPEALPCFPAGEGQSKQARAILEQAARGEISRDVATEMLSLLVTNLKILEVTELERRIAALEGRADNGQPA